MNQSLIIPEDATEVIIIPNTQRLSTEDGIYSDMFAPIIELTANLSELPHQYISTNFIAVLNKYATIVIRVTNTSISIINAYYDTADIIENAKITVWYK